MCIDRSGVWGVLTQRSGRRKRERDEIEFWGVEIGSEYICMLFPGPYESHARYYYRVPAIHHRERNEHWGIFLDEGALQSPQRPLLLFDQSRVPCTKVYPAKAAGPLVHRGIPTGVTNLEEHNQQSTASATHTPGFARSCFGCFPLFTLHVCTYLQSSSSSTSSS